MSARPRQRPTGRGPLAHWLRRHYFSKRGRYYCAISERTTQRRNAFPFKHRRSAALMARLGHLVTRRRFWVHAYVEFGGPAKATDVDGTSWGDPGR